MNEELKNAILDTLKKAVQHDLCYAEFDEDAMAEEFPDVEYPEPTLYLTDEGREHSWPLDWLNPISCDGLYGYLDGFPWYSIRTVATGDSMDTRQYGLQVEWSKWTLKLWESEVGATDATWADIETSAEDVLNHTKFPG